MRECETCGWCLKITVTAITCTNPESVNCHIQNDFKHWKPNTKNEVEQKLLNLFGFTKDGGVNVSNQLKIMEFMDWYNNLK